MISVYLFVSPFTRFSLVGDTVLGVGVEDTQLPEVTLDRGRRLELFFADERSSTKVEDRVKVAFKKAFDSGCFHVRGRWI